MVLPSGLRGGMRRRRARERTHPPGSGCCCSWATSAATTSGLCTRVDGERRRRSWFPDRPVPTPARRQSQGGVTRVFAVAGLLRSIRAKVATHWRSLLVALLGLYVVWPPPSVEWRDLVLRSPRCT